MRDTMMMVHLRIYAPLSEHIIALLVHRSVRILHWELVAPDIVVIDLYSLEGECRLRLPELLSVYTPSKRSVHYLRSLNVAILGEAISSGFLIGSMWLC